MNNFFIFFASVGFGLCVGIIGSLWVTLRFRIKDMDPSNPNYEKESKELKYVETLIEIIAVPTAFVILSYVIFAAIALYARYF